MKIRVEVDVRSTEIREYDVPEGFVMPEHSAKKIMGALQEHGYDVVDEVVTDEIFSQTVSLPQVPTLRVPTELEIAAGYTEQVMGSTL